MIRASDVPVSRDDAPALDAPARAVRRRGRAVGSPRGGLIAVLLVVGGLTVLAEYALVAPVWWGWAPQAVSLWADAQLWSWMLWAAAAAWVLRPVVSGPLVERQRAGLRTGAGVLWEPVRRLAPWQLLGGVVVAGLLVLLMAATTGFAPLQPAVYLLWVLSVLVAGWVFLLLGALTVCVVRHVSAVLLAPALVYLAVLLPPYLPGSDELMAAPGLVWREELPGTGALLGRLVFWCLLLAVLLVLLLRPVRWPAWLAAGGVAAVACAAGTVTAFAPVPIPGATEPACVWGQLGVRYCTTHAYQAGLMSAAGILDEGLAQLPFDYRPQAVVSGPDVAAPKDRPTLVLTPTSADGVHGPTTLPDREATLVLLGDALLGGDACTDRTPQGRDAQLMLRYWWRDRLGLSAQDTHGLADADPAQLFAPEVVARARAGANRFAALPEKQRRQILIEQRGPVQSCTASVDALLPR